MASRLEVHIVDAGDRTIKVTHTFWGLSESEVETYKREHLDSCEYFRAATQQGNTIEILEEVHESQLPAESDFEKN